MKCISVDAIEPGQTLGRTIFTSNGNVLLAEGVQLTVYMISTLRRIGVTMIYIKDPHFEDVEIEEVVSEATKRKLVQQMSDTFNTVLSGKEFTTKSISTSINSLLEDVMRNKEVLVQLSDIRTEENAMYIHALNVCTMSVLVGMNMGLNMLQLKDLAIGALLHDIGKLGASTESNDPRMHHTWRGFEILKNKREYNLLVAHTAFQHHEHMDGSGVPRGLTGENIHLYAKIVATVNLYDNLVSELSGTGRMKPHEACERMMAMSGKELDHDVLIQFLKIVSVYPTGTPVKLTNRETGVVVGQHRGLPGRPVVRVVKSTANDREFETVEFDLARHPTLFIENVLN